MKKAFMRGVCALNMEAMSMFRHHEPEQGGTYEGCCHYGNGTGQENDHLVQAEPTNIQPGTTDPVRRPLDHVQQTAVSSSGHQSTRQAPPVATTTLQVTTSANPPKNVRTTFSVPEPHGQTRGGATPSSIQTGHGAGRMTAATRPGRGGANSASNRVYRPTVFVQKH